MLIFCGLAPRINSAEAIYYECDFQPRYSTANTEAAFPSLNMRFMVNAKLQLAFRIDTPVARPIEMFVSDHGDTTLMDYQLSTEVALVTMTDKGNAVLSRHVFAKNRDNGVASTRDVSVAHLYSGKCLEISKVAGAFERR